MKVLQARRFLTEIIEVLQYEALIIMMEILPGLVVCHGSYYQGQIKNMALPVLQSIKPPQNILGQTSNQKFWMGNNLTPTLNGFNKNYGNTTGAVSMT